jgi:outer membrane protein assembly factor BamB
VRRAIAAAALAALAPLAMTGCAEATFSAHARDNSLLDLQRALKLCQLAPAAGGHANAFLVTTAPDKQLVGYDLEAGKILWQERVDVRSRVVIGRGWIAHRQGESQLVARDPQSGRVLVTVPLRGDEKFVGAALDDERLYYVVQSSGGAQRTSSVVAIDRTGRELWRMPAQGSLGAPAARGGLVAVPFLRQNVSLLDGHTGREVARVRSADEQVTFVRAVAEGFVYGGASGIYFLDENSVAGTREGRALTEGGPVVHASFAQAKFGSEQVRPFYYWDGYELAQADYSAFDRNRLLWRAQPGGASGLGFQDDLAILHSYRYFFAFDAKSGKLRWAYAHPRVDVVSADAVGPSVVFAAIDGAVGAIDAATGAVRVSYKPGLRLAGASFDADGFAGGAAPAKADLLKTLEQIVWDPDARFTAVKVFSVAAIGDIPGPDASAALLKIVLKETGVPPAVQKRADEILVARRDDKAVPLYLDALKLHFDYLADRHPHGVDVLAHALASLDVKQAAPELAAHLLDPATPQAALKELAAALAGLGGKEAVRALRELLLTYRSDPMFLAEPAALTIAAEGLLKLGGADGKRTVTFVAGEPRTLAPLARYLKKALEPAPAPAAK